MKRILLPIDFSDTTNKIVNLGVEIAKKFNSEIILVHVESPEPDFVGYEPGPQVQRDSVAKKIHSNQSKLEELEKEINSKGVKVEAFLIQGPTVEKILSEAEKMKVDLMVFGSHGHGAMYHLMLGSVSQGILKGATCPVLLVPPSKKSA